MLDVACGGGDVAIRLVRRAIRKGVGLEIDGCDKSREAVRYAQHKAKEQAVRIRFFALDAVKDAIPEGYDVVTCSLFLHHLDEAEASGLLTRMAQSTARLVLVNDLVRSRAGYALAWAGCRLLSRSPIVRHDGPVSVAAAFTLSEVRELASRAGIAVRSPDSSLAVSLPPFLESRQSPSIARATHSLMPPAVPPGTRLSSEQGPPERSPDTSLPRSVRVSCSSTRSGSLVRKSAAPA